VVTEADPLTYKNLTLEALTCGPHRTWDPPVSEPTSGNGRVGHVKGSLSGGDW
jgi:hypothetical protein